MLIGQGYLNGVEVFALDILHECHLHHVLILNGADIGGNGAHAGQLRGTPTALTGHNLVATIFHQAQGDGLDDANLADAGGQFLHGLLVKLAAGLVGIGTDLVEGYLAEIRRALGMHFARVNQGIETAPIANIVKTATQNVAVIFLVYCHNFNSC